jgi:hypothetical protein
MNEERTGKCVLLYTLKSAGHERGMVAHEDSFILNHINKKEKTPLKIIVFFYMYANAIIYRTDYYFLFFPTV